MPNIVKELSLNKHPKDCKDLSLINARNIVVSNDFSCLQNELGITHHSTLTNYLEDKVLVGYIPCNDEIVLFTCPKNKFGGQEEDFDYAGLYCTIARYNENQDEFGVQECLDNFIYHYGTITGTFTYNVQGNLIIAVAEADPAFGQIVPLRTINLGKFGDTEVKGTDKELDSGLHAISPELRIPKLSDFNYVPGTTYKGWYYFFIRYKINNIDYTHWFPIGYPIFICDIEKQTIFKYGFKLKGESNYNIAGAIDYFSSKSDISKETINILIDDLDNESNEDDKNKYKFYQIGFICVSKDSSKAFRSNDIDINVNNFTVSIPEVNSYSVEELILDNYNYYNVKNVINYQNRLYISNFKEHTNPVITDANLAKIELKYVEGEDYLDDFSYQNITVDTNGVVDSTESKSKNTADYLYLPANPVYTGTLISSLKIGNNCKITLSEGEYNETGTLTLSDGSTIPAQLYIKVYHTPRLKTNRVFTITSVINDTTYQCKYKANNSTICKIQSNQFDSDIIISGENTIVPGKLFIDTDTSFKKRKKESTLIPGEIYSFYIHFVNKYGEATDGYRIPNTFGAQNIQTIYYSGSRGTASFPINQKVFNDDGTIYLSGEETVQPIPPATPESVILNIQGMLGSLQNIPNLKWFQIPEIRPINQTDYFIPFENDNGDILYRLPLKDVTIVDGKIKYNTYKLYVNLHNFVMPEGYIGYYISYEKFEKTHKIKGIITKRDISNENKVAGDSDNKVEYDKYNGLDVDNLDVVHFYSSNLDINDNIDLDFNAVSLTRLVTLANNDCAYAKNSRIEFANAKFPSNLNKPESADSSYMVTFAVDKYSLSVAGDALKNKTNLGTSIELGVTNNIKTIFANNTNIYKASLIKLSTNIYTNENKILIKLSDVYYVDREVIIEKGYNGYLTYNDFIVYDFNKFVFNSGNNLVLCEKYGTYYKTDVYDVDGNTDGDYNDNEDYVVKYIDELRAPLFYAQIITYDTIINEAKSFKNEPGIYYLQLEKTIVDDKINTQIKQFAENIIVIPQNTIDLFQNKYPTQDALNPKTFTNYDKNKSYLDEYNKRVHRSNIIADESNENSWRIFPLEGYKDINENKGSITNLVGIGTTLLVHTEHSLFMFDRSNTLQTADKEVQLAMPDIFDVDYKEVFTSDLGICGLQDKFATIVDQFGYVFYDNDAHRIYKFGQGKVDNIDLDIVQFINKYKPYQIRFAHDKEANRLLVNMRIYVAGFDQQSFDYEQEVTLSYNYIIGKWISFHDYVFDRAFNTKNMLYLLIDRIEDGIRVFSDIYIINYIPNYKFNYLSARNVRYNYFENTRDEVENPQPVNSRIDIICNKNYDIIKYLEYIAYKLYKINIDRGQYLPTPVEELKQPYSGHTLRVFNTEVDTNIMDILIDDQTYNTGKNTSVMNYKKPWWELGNWNFSYLRDKKQGKVKFPTRLYGNYFIVSFTVFDDMRRIEFETLDYQATKDKV